VQTLAEEISKRLEDVQALRDFYQKKQAYDTERIDLQEFARFVIETIAVQQWPLQISPALKRLVEDRKLFAETTSWNFVREWTAYRDQVMRGALQSGPALALYTRDQEIRQLQHFALLEISKDDWQQLQAQFPEDGQALAFDAHRRFYAIAEERDRIFAEKIQNIFETDRVNGFSNSHRTCNMILSRSSDVGRL
jgi:hypothetical protein